MQIMNVYHFISFRKFINSLLTDWGLMVLYKKAVTRKSDDSNFMSVCAFDLSQSFYNTTDFPNHFNDENASFLPVLIDTKEIASRLISTLHAIPNLFDQSELIYLDSLKIYIGRSKTPANRARSHYEAQTENERRSFFIPVCFVPAKKIKFMEAFGIKYLEFLRDKNKLCVGELLNKKSESLRYFNNSENLESGDHTLYISFKIDKKCVSYGLIEKEEVLKLSHQFEYSLESDEDCPSLNKLFNDSENDIFDLIDSAGAIDKKGIKLFWHNMSK